VGLLLRSAPTSLQSDDRRIGVLIQQYLNYSTDTSSGGYKTVLSHNCWNTSVEIRCIKTSQEETTTTTFVVRVCKSDPLSHIRIFGYFKSQIRIFIRILINTTFTCCMHPQAYDCWLTSSCALCLTFVIFWIDLFNICCNL